MSLTVIQQPNTYALVENGLLYKVQRDVFYPIGTAAVFILTVLDDFEGQTDKYFTVMCMGQPMRFDFVETPENPFELRRWVTGTPRATFITNLIEDLKRNYYLLANYLITPVTLSSGVKFEARQTGSGFNITDFATNSDFLIGTPGLATDGSRPAGYRMFLGLRAADETILASELVPADEDRIGAADFSVYIRDLLQTSFTFPFEPTELVKVLPDAVLSFHLLYGEFFDNQIQLLTTGEEVFAVPGGLSQSDKDLLENIGSDYFTGLDAAARFLTWCPDNKRTAWGVPERLFLLNVLKVPFNIYAKIYYADETDETIDLGELASSNKIYEILCGLHEIKPAADPETVLRYEIYGHDGTDQVTEKRTFVVDQLPRYKRRGFIFKNSFDVYETLMCTGELSIADNISRDTMEVIDNRAYRIRINKTENLAKFKCHTGFLDGLANRRWLEDFLRSKEVYWIVGDAILPIILTTGEAERERDKEFLHALAFEFTLDVSEERYSAIINEGLHYLRDEAFVIVQDEDGIKLEGF